MWTTAFWKDTAERAIKTGCQALLLFWGADQIWDAFELDFQRGAGIFLGGVVLAVLTSIVSSTGFVSGHLGNASLVSTNEYNQSK